MFNIIIKAKLCTSFRSLGTPLSFNCYFSSIISPWTPQRSHQGKIFLKQYTLVYYFFISNDEDFVAYLLLPFMNLCCHPSFNREYIYNPFFVFNLWSQSTLHSGTFFKICKFAFNPALWLEKSCKQCIHLNFQQRPEV